MKKMLLANIIALFVLSMTQQAMGQAAWYASPGTGSGSLLTNTSTTGVGINNPPSVDGTLTINGSLSLNNTSAGTDRYIAGHTTYRFDLYGNTSITNGPYMTMWGSGSSNYGGIDFVDLDLSGTSGYSFWKYGSSSGYTEQMKLDNGGNMTLYTGNLSLSVGNISLASGNLSMSTGSETIGTGNLTLTSGSETIGTGNLTLNSGNVTVGGGNLSLNNASGSATRSITGNTTTGILVNYCNTNSANGPGIEMWGTGSSSTPGSISLISSGTSGNAFRFLDYKSSAWVAIMNINKNGTIVMDNTDANAISVPTGYTLYVGKGILTEKLKVANSTDPFNWSDFVFNKDYNLMSLDKVASYIKVNKHLPEIPTASEVAKDGIDVADMDARLLQKIEELTLYVIEQQKEIDELKKQQKH